MFIHSSQNPTFKLWKKLHTKKGRRAQQRFLIEGIHMAEEALQSTYIIDEMIISEDFNLPESWAAQIKSAKPKVMTLTNELFSQISSTPSPQGIAMTVRLNNENDVKSVMRECTSLMLIDQVQDPGNLGTIMRTADAAGIDAVILGKGTVDVYSDKVLRSTQGSVFHIPLVEADLFNTILTLREQNWSVVGTSLQGATPYTEMGTIDHPYALLVGNEANGCSEQLLDLVTHKVKIPMYGKVESLNVGVATGILLYYLQHETKHLPHR
ncbi:TrmH family RNA methyltransferase [Caldalkalibacillus salinus]|uniref:TrmH family RNA methyltransferase n=1 Tax=Caldalkalibacillus salinus TaxID=2803787 RepID=UPI001923F682|nr:RNA methyltransferase [Caldalkalibacillus salinus]